MAGLSLSLSFFILILGETSYGRKLVGQLPYYIETMGDFSSIECKKDVPCITRCLATRPQPVKHVLKSTLVFEKQECTRTSKTKTSDKCEWQFGSCYRDFSVRYANVSVTISALLNVSNTGKGLFRIFEWDHLTVDISNQRDAERNLILKDMEQKIEIKLEKLNFHMLIKGFLGVGRIQVRDVYIDDEKKEFASHRRELGSNNEHGIAFGIIRFGQKWPDATTGMFTPLTGNISLFDIFASDQTTSAIHKEYQFIWNKQQGFNYPECLCSDGTLPQRNDRCEDGSYRLIGRLPRNTSYFAPVQAVSDGIIDDHHGFWVMDTEYLMLMLDEPSMVYKFEVYAYDQEIIVAYGSSGDISTYMTGPTGPFHGSVSGKGVVLETIDTFPFRKYTWTWDNATAPYIVNYLHFHFKSTEKGERFFNHSGLPPNLNPMFEVIIFGRPFNRFLATTHCICFLGNVEAGDECNCEQCKCRSGNRTLAGKLCEPYITHVEPRYTYLSGGTSITIYGGLLLPFASNVSAEITLGTNRICNVSDLNDNRLICLVEYLKQPESELGVENVTVQIKLREFPYPARGIAHVELTPDPTIHSMSPYKTMFRAPFATSIKGKNLAYLDRVSLIVEIGPSGYNLWNGNCTINDNSVICNGAVEEPEELEDAASIGVDIGIEMDAIPTYDNLTATLPDLGQFTLLRRPFLTVRPVEKGDRVFLEGKYLSNCRNYSITDGQQSCPVTNISDTTIQCISSGNLSLTSIIVRACGIGVIFNSSAIVDDDGEIGSSEKTNAAAIACGILFPVAIVLAIIVIILKRKQGKKTEDLESQENALYQELLDTESPTTDDFLNLLPGDLKQTIEQNIIDERRLTIKTEIGKGNFGKVLSGILAGETNIDVAVKTLREDGSVGTRELIEFLEEATIMKNFSHPNILNLLGIAVRDGRVYVLLPLMINGDLKTYISKEVFSRKENVHFLCDVANGMSYLAEQKFVHRDLAARNCMVDAAGNVRIADFGLARDIYEKDYYRTEDRQRALPIKWMALETLLTRTFSSMSDIWSFGVVMWEVFSRGERPYAHIKNINMKGYLRRGFRLEKPEGCPDDLYELMRSCWRKDPIERPTFRFLLFELEKLLKQCDNQEHSGQKTSPSSSSTNSTACSFSSSGSGQYSDEDSPQSINTTSTLLSPQHAMQKDLLTGSGSDEEAPCQPALKPIIGNLEDAKTQFPEGAGRTIFSDGNVSPAYAKKPLAVRMLQEKPPVADPLMGKVVQKRRPMVTTAERGDMNTGELHSAKSLLFSPASGSGWDPREGSSKQHSTSIVSPVMRNDFPQLTSTVDENGYIQPLGKTKNEDYRHATAETKNKEALTFTGIEKQVTTKAGKGNTLWFTKEPKKDNQPECFHNVQVDDPLKPMSKDKVVYALQPTSIVRDDDYLEPIGVKDIRSCRTPDEGYYNLPSTDGEGNYYQPPEDVEDNDDVETVGGAKKNKSLKKTSACRESASYYQSVETQCKIQETDYHEPPSEVQKSERGIVHERNYDQPPSEIEAEKHDYYEPPSNMYDSDYDKLPSDMQEASYDQPPTEGLEGIYDQTPTEGLEGIYDQPPSEDQGQIYDQPPNEDEEQIYDQPLSEDQEQIYDQPPSEERVQNYDRLPREDKAQDYDQPPIEQQEQIYDQPPSEDQGQIYDQPPSEDQGQIYDQPPSEEQVQDYDQPPGEDQEQDYDQPPSEDHGKIYDEPPTECLKEMYNQPLGELQGTDHPKSPDATSMSESDYRHRLARVHRESTRPVPPKRRADSQLSDYSARGDVSQHRLDRPGGGDTTPSPSIDRAGVKHAAASPIKGRGTSKPDIVLPKPVVKPIIPARPKVQKGEKRESQ